MVVLFEVHLIVKPTQGYLAILFEVAESMRTDPGYLSDLGVKYIRPRATMAVTKYGLHPEQAMLTYWCRMSEGDVVDLTSKVVEHLLPLGLEVIRTKIEATTDSIPPVASGDHYYEYHFKVEVPSPAEWQRLAEACAPFGAHLFFNAFSKSPGVIPVITLRHYDCTRKESTAKLNELMVALGHHGFHAAGETQREYSVLDSKVELDEGWLFEGTPKNILTELPRRA